MGSTVIACGKAFPKRVVTNDELAAFIDTSDEWIVERTGIHSRHIAMTESATDLACQAARAAMGIDEDGWQTPRLHEHPDEGASGLIDSNSIDLVICMTLTPDAAIPSQAGLVKAQLGLNKAIAFDINAACAGCIYGYVIADGLMSTAAATGSLTAAVPVRNPIKRALLIGVERLSRVLNWKDRSSCILFGDAAGATILEWQDGDSGIIASFLKNTDDADLSLSCPTIFDLSTFPWMDDFGKDYEPCPYDTTSGSVAMKGQKVFKFATSAMIEALREVLKRGGCELDDLACIVPHQANERIIRYVAKKIGKPLDFFQLSIADMGNTSAASVPVSLTDAYLNGRIKPGDIVALVGFGGGLNSGAVLFRA